MSGGKRKCYKCSETKPLEEFAKDKRKKSGRSYICKVCKNIIWQKYYHNNREEYTRRRLKRYYENRENRLLRNRESYKKNRKKLILKSKMYGIKARYGISYEQYLGMVKERNGICDICGNSERILSIDHCHKTGKIRGLLCFRCNTALGSLDDNIDILASAISYLQNAQFELRRVI